MYLSQAKDIVETTQERGVGGYSGTLEEANA